MTTEGTPDDYWSADADTLTQRLRTTRDGLSAEEAAARLRQYGPNQIRNSLLLVFAAMASAM